MEKALSFAAWWMGVEAHKHLTPNSFSTICKIDITSMLSLLFLLLPFAHFRDVFHHLHNMWTVKLEEDFTVRSICFHRRSVEKRLSEVMLVHAWIFNAITRIMNRTLAQRLCGHFCRRFSCAPLINYVRVCDSWNPTTRYHLLIFYALWTQRKIEASCQRSHEPCDSRREMSERNVTQEIKCNYVGG